MALAKKAGLRQCSVSLRKQYCKLFPCENRKSFQLHEKQISLQSQIQDFCRLMEVTQWSPLGINVCSTPISPSVDCNAQPRFPSPWLFAGRYISLIETTVRLIDHMFLQKSRFWVSANILVLPEQYGFWTWVSPSAWHRAKQESWYLFHWTSKAHMIVTSLLQFVNSHVMPSESIPYLDHVMLDRHLKVVFHKSQGSAWINI